MIFGGILIGLVLVGTIYLNRFITFPKRVQISIGAQSIKAEVARTPIALARGLSGRDGLGENESMLFIFGIADRHGFWMKDMKFPIDIIWLKDNKIIGFTENIEPQIGAKTQDLKIYYPPEPVDRVLELRAGRARLLNAQVGDMIKIEKSL